MANNILDYKLFMLILIFKVTYIPLEIIYILAPVDCNNHVRSWMIIDMCKKIIHLILLLLSYKTLYTGCVIHITNIADSLWVFVGTVAISLGSYNCDDAGSPIYQFVIVLLIITYILMSSFYIHYFCDVAYSDNSIINVESPRKVINTEYGVDICPICLEYYTPKDIIKIFPCSHKYHAKCIDKWLTVKPTCPVCRNILNIENLTVEIV